MSSQPSAVSDEAVQAAVKVFWDCPANKRAGIGDSDVDIEEGVRAVLALKAPMGPQSPAIGCQEAFPRIGAFLGKQLAADGAAPDAVEAALAVLGIVECSASDLRRIADALERIATASQPLPLNFDGRGA